MNTHHSAAKGYEALADQAFASYEFGSGVKVTDASGWEYSSPGLERSRKVYVEVIETGGEQVSRNQLTFTVRFDAAGSLVEAYAIDSHGQIWGQLPNQTPPIRSMTYGDGNAIIVLVGDQMGLTSLCINEAREQLEGKQIHPMVAVAIEREAVRIANSIRRDEALVAQANELSEQMKRSYGFIKTPSVPPETSLEAAPSPM